MAETYLGELIHIAARIVQLDELEPELEGTREWRAGKAEYEAQEARFKEVRAKYVDQLLEEGARDTVVDDVQSQLNTLREECDPSWYPAVDYTRDNLLFYVDKEADKDPRVRKAIKAAPFVAGALAVIIYLGVRLFSGTPVTASMETRDGILQRAAATEKVIRYDDWMGTRVRRGGWLKGILFWPIEPTEAEIEGAAEFVGLVFEGQQHVKGCGSVTGYGDSLSDQQIKMVSDVAGYVQRDDVKWENPAVLTILAGLERAGSC